MAISIHAACEGGDHGSNSQQLIQRYFNPRRPWGRRPKLDVIRLPTRDFKPRRPWGRRLFDQPQPRPCDRFQSTPPVGAATEWLNSTPKEAKRFQSTPPVGAATRLNSFINGNDKFQSTPPVGAATAKTTEKYPGDFCKTSYTITVLHKFVQNATVNLTSDRNYPCLLSEIVVRSGRVLLSACASHRSYTISMPSGS